MQIFKTVAELKNHLAPLLSQGSTIGFVPTMGALHSGHLSLVRHASRENDFTVVSIFVNPTQFNNASDLEKYPRDVENDLQKLQQTDCDMVFLPTEREMYPGKTESVEIDLNGLDKVMEGAHRPGHFDGVATIVSRFFEVVKPTRAYFGEKDFQQLLIIRQLTNTLNLPVEIVGHPIERSAKGLALSSRNELLSDEDKEQALVLWQALQWMKQNYADHTPVVLCSEVKKLFEGSNAELEYVQVVDEYTLKPLLGWTDVKHARAFIAAYISGVRLIDNLQLF